MSRNDSLAILFSSVARLKLLRLFLFNVHSAFGVDEVVRRAKLVRRTARTELNALERAGIIRKKALIEEGSGRKRRIQGYTANTRYAHIRPLQAFLLETAPIESKLLERRMRPAGRIDVLVATGVFMREFDRRLDVLVATPKPQSAKIEAGIRHLEAELGVEIRYAAFETKDLIYRLGMYDKLTRDVFDYPHHLIIDKIGVRDEMEK